MVRGRGNVDNAILDTLRRIVTRLDVVETAQRRGVHLNDVSDDEVVAENPNLEPEEDQDEERLSNPVMEVVPYDGKLDINVVFDWIFAMASFFEFENTPNNRMVKIVVKRLKGHASLWWENLQIGRKREEKNLDEDDE